MSPRYEIRPLGTWIGPVTANPTSSSRFRAQWQDTLKLLQRETEHLGAKLVVLQVDVHAGDIRLDGMLRANARVGARGVRVSFDSHHGPLTYATDAYDRVYSGDPPAWQANIRAIALSLEALRAVNRYGVSKTGEQYRGWTAIEAGPARSFNMTSDQAADLLAAHSGDRFTAARILADADARDRAYKTAISRNHPDLPGFDRDLFDHLNAARDLLERTRLA